MSNQSLQGNIVRTLSESNDFTYGNNLSGYRQTNAAIGQQIQCRLNQYLGECFFDTQAGINWLGYMGSKNPVGLNLAIASVILNTTGVLGINTLVFNLDHETRIFTINWDVSTVFTKYFPGNTTLTVGG